MYFFYFQQLNSTKQYNEDLERHLSGNSRRDNLTAVYRCERCEKAFSTENYLNSHIKRRHNNEQTEAKDDDDKIQSEIKDLKERLNSTDKLLQQIQITEPPVERTNTEFERKFYLFREQVENDISALHLEKNIFEEKYTRLFDLILQSKEKQMVVHQNIGTMTSDICNFSNITENQEIQNTYSASEKSKIENSTQTEQITMIKLKQNTDQIESINDSENADFHMRFVSDEQSEKQIEETQKTLSEDIENKVCLLINGNADSIINKIRVFIHKKIKYFYVFTINY